MKKEYLILILVIAGLCAYLLIHNENRSNYSLPELKSLAAADITAIAIEQRGKTVQMAKTNGVWGITEKGYPADTDKINALIKTIKDLRITALVSEKANLQRYQLDAENRIKVTVSDPSGEIRTVEVGKPAPSYNHTFIKLEGDDYIYHAAGNFRRDFEADLNDLRNKQVLSFDENHIKGIQLNTSGITRTLVATTDKPSDAALSPETTGESTPEEEQKVTTEEKSVWHFQDDNTPGNEEALTQLLSTLSSLTCDGYTPDEDKKNLEETTPMCRITLNGEQEKHLTLFDKKGDGNFPARSSDTPYPFVLDEYQAKEILSKVNTLLGIEKEAVPAEEPQETPEEKS